MLSAFSIYAEDSVKKKNSSDETPTKLPILTPIEWRKQEDSHTSTRASISVMSSIKYTVHALLTLSISIA